jgi:hypothetical protein
LEKPSGLVAASIQVGKTFQMPCKRGSIQTETLGETLGRMKENIFIVVLVFIL